MTRPNTTQTIGAPPVLNPKRLKSAQIDRNAYRQEANAMIWKQRSKIEFLVQQNNALKETVINFYHKNFAELNADGIERGQNAQEADRLRTDITTSEEELKKLEEQIRIFQKQLLVQKQKAAGGAPIGAPRSLFKALKTMENRLDQATQKFNQQVTENTQLRRQIESFKKERGIFQSLYRKVEDELRKKTKKIEQIIVDCRQVYDERDVLTERIANVKELAKREMRDFEHELRDLIALKEKNASNKLAIANLNGNTRTANVKKKPVEGHEGGFFSVEPGKATEHEDRLRLDLAKLKMVARAHHPTGLVAELEQIQDRNFEQYNSIIVLAAELEWLEGQIASFQKHEGQVADLSRPQTLLRREGISETQSELQEYTSKNIELQQEICTLQKNFALYKEVVNQLHIELCESAPEPETSFSERLMQVEQELMGLLVGIGNDERIVC